MSAVRLLILLLVHCSLACLVAVTLMYVCPILLVIWAITTHLRLTLSPKVYRVFWLKHSRSQGVLHGICHVPLSRSARRKRSRSAHKIMRQCRAALFAALIQLQALGSHSNITTVLVCFCVPHLICMSSATEVWTTKSCHYDIFHARCCTILAHIIPSISGCIPSFLLVWASRVKVLRLASFRSTFLPAVATGMTLLLCRVVGLLQSNWYFFKKLD